MKLIVTGSSGLIGSEVVAHFCKLGWDVHGFDNNMRADFFGPGGDTSWNRSRLVETFPNFTHHTVDIRDRAALKLLVADISPRAVLHAAAQPSHDLAASRPFDDFDVNAVGTMNMLEAVRLANPDASFVHLSTNKVYGDAPNELPLDEHAKRWDYARQEDWNGIREDMRIDQSTHSLFGASKVAADVFVQEYGRYFGMHTCCLRGGCLTGPNHSGVQLHGYLSYLVKVNLEGGTYRVFGYKGKQVRDNIHSHDVACFAERFFDSPRCGEVYNIGGGRGNSCSILEAFDRVAQLTGKPMQYTYEETNRRGDHICYISNLDKLRSHYPGWDITRNLDVIFEEIVASWRTRLTA